MWGWNEKHSLIILHYVSLAIHNISQSFGAIAKLHICRTFMQINTVLTIFKTIWTRGARLVKALGLKMTEPPKHSFHMSRSKPCTRSPNGIKDRSKDYTATSPTPTTHSTWQIGSQWTPNVWEWKKEVCVCMCLCVERNLNTSKELWNYAILKSLHLLRLWATAGPYCMYMFWYTIYVNCIKLPLIHCRQIKLARNVHVMLLFTLKSGSGFRVLL